MVLLKKKEGSRGWEIERKVSNFLKFVLHAITYMARCARIQARGAGPSSASLLALRLIHEYKRYLFFESPCSIKKMQSTGESTNEGNDLRILLKVPLGFLLPRLLDVILMPFCTCNKASDCMADWMTKLDPNLQDLLRIPVAKVLGSAVSGNGSSAPQPCFPAGSPM